MSAEAPTKLETLRIVREASVVVLLIFVFAAAFRVVVGFDPPLGEVAIGAIVTISGFNTVRGAYQDYQSWQGRKAVSPVGGYGPPGGGVS